MIKYFCKLIFKYSLFVFLFLTTNQTLLAQWTIQSGPDIHYLLRSVCFIDNENGWAVGSSGKIMHYDGEKWDKVISHTNFILGAVSFVDKNHGWAVGWYGTILKYNGNDWIKQNIGYTDFNFKSVIFTDSLYGWILGVDRNDQADYDLLINIKDNKTSIYEFKPLSHLNKLFFSDRNHGWAIGGWYDWNDNWQKKYSILKYNGTEWKIEETGTKYYPLNSVFFIDSLNGWAVGDSGTILHYNGKKWTQQRMPTKYKYYLNDVFFTDKNNGWAVGESGIILKYDGKQWAVQDSANAYWLTSVYFTDKDHGWAVGVYGTIMNTTNGGGEIKHYSILGNIAYDNAEKSPIKYTKLYLRDEENYVIDSTFTDQAGNYKFEQIIDGDYTIEPAITIGWGGVNPIDALLANDIYLGTFTMTEPLKEKATNVNNDNSINPVDALLINKRYISLITGFSIPDWIYDNKPVVTVNGSDAIHNLTVICAGDVNGSYKP